MELPFNFASSINLNFNCSMNLNNRKLLLTTRFYPHAVTCMPISLIESILLSEVNGKGMTHLIVYLLFFKKLHILKYLLKCSL